METHICELILGFKFDFKDCFLLGLHSLKPNVLGATTAHNLKGKVFHVDIYVFFYITKK